MKKSDDFSRSLVKSATVRIVILLRSSRGKRHSKERRILFLLTCKLTFQSERYSFNLPCTERTHPAKFLHFSCRPPSECRERFSAEDDPKRLIFWGLCYNTSTINLEYLNPKSKKFRRPTVLFLLGFLADRLLSG